MAVCLAIARAAHAEEAPPGAPLTKEAPAGETLPPGAVDLDHPETFMDVSEAVRSRQYVHRTILSTVIKATTRFSGNRFYVNHFMGFSSVVQAHARYAFGLQGLAAGYVSNGGHGIELGLEFSALSNVYAGYRYFWKPANFSLWPLFGFGVGYQVPSLNLSQPVDFDPGVVVSKAQGYGLFALLLPLVDVGLRAEVRITVQGFKRIIITQGIGVILFL